MKILLFLFLTCALAFADVDERAQKREAMIQSAGINRAYSKELPEAISSLPVFGEIEWTVNEMPFIEKGSHAGVSGGAMEVVQGQIYYAGGFIPAGDETEDGSRRTSRWAHRYDPKTGEWTRLPDLPARREYTRGIATADAFYVLGGYIQGKPGHATAEVFRLDTAKQPLAWETIAPLQVPRSHLSVSAVGRLLLAVGGNNYDIAERGYSGATIQNVTEVFDLDQPGKGWVTRKPVPGLPRGWCATSEVDGKLYVLGGVTFHGSGKEARAPRTRLKETLSYDPARDEWRRHADAPVEISGWEGVTYGGRYIILAGGAGLRWNDVPLVYDAHKDRWLRVPNPLPPGGLFNDPGVCLIGDTLYVAGGEGPGGSHFNYFLIGKIKPHPETP